MLGKLQGHSFVKRNPLGMKHAALRIRLVHNIECLAARHCRSLPRFHHQFALWPTQRFAARTDKNHHRIFNHDAGGQQFLRLNHAARGGKVRAEMEFSLCHIRDDLLGCRLLLADNHLLRLAGLAILRRLLFCISTLSVLGTNGLVSQPPATHFR